jgi:predicted ATP-grasp superfamily ATP-dependent carboligase
MIDITEIDRFANDKNYKIMPLMIDQNIILNDLSNNIFINDIANLEKLDDKSKFAEYMLANFSNNSPIIYYYNYDNHTFINNIQISYPIIAKPNKSFSGIGIQILNKINYELKDHVIQKYVNHIYYYSGHFLIMSGVILYKTYFKSKMNSNMFICGQIVNYETLQNLDINDDVFDGIFCDLNYSGFACVDFTINENNIIIFEINPRPGGSLINNTNMFNIFLDKLDEYFENSMITFLIIIIFLILQNIH